MRKLNSSQTLKFCAFAALLLSQSAHALEMNWSGQFWSEFHSVSNYTLDSAGGLDAARTSGNAPTGYYIPGGGSNTTGFETLFFRLRPKLIVNDNIYIKSEWWAGDPITGFFGSAYPFVADQRLYNATYSRGATISAQRFWAELMSDFGTVQIGRAPLDWGLGVVWNSGDSLFSKYQSTADSIRVISKFGNFAFIPSVNVYSVGNSIGGNCVISGGICTPSAGFGRVTDYSIALKYENLDEEMDGGVNFVKRIADGAIDTTTAVGPQGTGAGSNYNTWDFYGRKRWGKFTLAGELPVTSGNVGGADYSSVAVAVEGSWKPSDTWETQLKAGIAPGQPNQASATVSSYKAFYFHPNYDIGNIMFNYQFANFAGYPGVNTQNSTSATAGQLRSIYDNPIVNARYVSLNQLFKTQKWTFNTALIYAQAPESAAAGNYYFNTWQRKMDTTAAVKTQGNNLGFEVDLGAGFQWDDNFQFRLDMGLWFPGDYYAFSNTATDNATNSVFSTTAKIGITF